MNRNIFYIIFLIFISCLFLQGKPFEKNEGHDIFNPNDSSFSSWKEELTNSFGVPEPAINLAINGYYALKTEKLLTNDSILTIIDFSSPSTEHRFFVLDLKNCKVIKNSLVAHGMNSGVNVAESFSNNRHSNKSSLGLFLTAETYEGKHGYSLRLDGMNEGINDNARKRAIVIHGADYVSESFIEKNGRIGRSFGCPALSLDEVTEIIDLIKNGSCLFIYHPSVIPISKEDLEKLP